MEEQVKADFADQADELEAKGYRGLAAFLRLTDRRPKQTEVLVPTEVIDPTPAAQLQPVQQVYVIRSGHAIPVEAVMEARSELNVGEDAWRRRATINLLNARRRKGRNLTEAEIHEITRRTR